MCDGSENRQNPTVLQQCLFSLPSSSSTDGKIDAPVAEVKGSRGRLVILGNWYGCAGGAWTGVFKKLLMVWKKRKVSLGYDQATAWSICGSRSLPNSASHQRYQNPPVGCHTGKEGKQSRTNGAPRRGNFGSSPWKRIAIITAIISDFSVRSRYIVLLFDPFFLFQFVMQLTLPLALCLSEERSIGGTRWFTTMGLGLLCWFRTWLLAYLWWRIDQTSLNDVKGWCPLDPLVRSILTLAEMACPRVDWKSCLS